MASRTNSKRKRPTSEQLRRAMQSLPTIKHIGEPPAGFLAAFKHELRTLALRPRHGEKYETGKSQFDLMAEVLCRIDDAIVRRYCPPWQVLPAPRSPRLIRIYWSEIASTDVKQQTIYHWSDHWLQINGGRYRVGWHPHFMLQMLNRIGGEDNTWLRFSFAEVLRNIKIEPEEDDGVWLWKTATDSSPWGDVIRLLTGGDPESYERRIAYCPIEYVGKFARLKTCLIPAMRVSGINAALIDADREFDCDIRCWEEITKLHQVLPMFRRKRQDWLAGPPPS